MSSYSFRQIIGTGGLLAWAMIAQNALAASATSDALIILEADGRSFTLQQTIASDGPLVVLDIPSDASTHQLSFLGPNQGLLQENRLQSGGPVKLWEGVALVRYRHQYKEELVKTGPHRYRLSIPSLPQNFAVEDGDISRSSYTWVFPQNVELLSYSAISEDMGRWQLNDNELAYEQTERFAVTLSIEFKVGNTDTVTADTKALAADTFCIPTADNPDLCAADSDADAVPDYRDVCWDEDSIAAVSAAHHTNERSITEIAANATFGNHLEKEELFNTNELGESSASEPNAESHWQRLFGCEGSTHLILSDVQFPSGYSYLGVDSRNALDRLAEAIQMTDTHFEIGAHTDNKGNENTNLALAKKRADTVRYYLLLRGVDPNQIRAKGYGEEFPIMDNSTVEGQRGNRRIEITPVQ